MKRVSEEIVALIPARKGSKGIPGKVMSNLGGRPLIDWTLEFAASQKLRTIVSTDSNDVRELASSYRFEIDDRPTGLCGDTTEMSEVSLHLINKYQLGGSLLVLLQPTSPFRKSEDFENAVNKYSEGKCSLVKAVTPASKSIFKCGVINGYLKNITGDNSVFLRIGRIFLTFFRLLGRIICFEVMIFLGREVFQAIKYYQ